MDLFTTLLAFGAGAGAAKLAARTREHRKEPAGLADLLGWGFLVGEGVVLQKDGSFLAGWRYRGPDLTSSTAAELDVLSKHVSDALRPYGDNWMFHVDAVRRPSASYAPEGAFPDPVTRLIDEERRRAYTGGRTYYETDYVLVATYLPPPELYSRLGSLFVRGGSGATLLEGSDWAHALSNYEAALGDLEGRLSARLRLDRLSSDALCRHLHACLTGLHHPVRAPEHGAYLGYVLADRPLVGGFRPRIGDRHVRAVAVQGYPHETHAGLLDFLGGLGYPFRWSNRIIPMSYQAAAKEIRRQQLGWFQKRKGAAALVKDMAGGGKGEKSAAKQRDDELFMDGDAQRMAEDAKEAMAANASGEVRFCYYTSTLLVMEPDPERADYVAGELVKGLNDRGFTARVEDVNALEAYLGSLPGHGHANLRRPVLSSANIADLLPTTSIWPGLEENPSHYFPTGSPALLWAATAGTTPFRVNLHDDDVGHTLVIGSTGAGKSVLVNTLIAQWFRYPGAQVFLFDLGYSGYLLAKAAGATHYNIAAGRNDVVRFQPLARIDDPTERAWAAEWLEVLFALQGQDVTPALRKRIDRALELVARSPRENRTLTELSVQLQSRDLKAALRPYTVDGNLGHLLDADADGLQEGARYQVFEMKHLTDLSDKVLVPVLLYLFRRVEQQLSAGRPTLIVIEEAWAALMRSLFADRIKQWLLTLRKENAAVVMVAHSPSQLAALENRQLLVESCPTRVFLPNADALEEESARLYEGLGLNRTEIGIVGRARRKRDYYFSSPKGSRLFSLGLGRAALTFLASAPGKSMQETIREADELAAQYGPAWPAELLRRRSLDRWAGELTADALSGAPSGEAGGDGVAGSEPFGPPADTPAGVSGGWTPGGGFPHPHNPRGNP